MAGGSSCSGGETKTPPDLRSARRLISTLATLCSQPIGNRGNVPLETRLQAGPTLVKGMLGAQPDRSSHDLHQPDRGEGPDHHPGRVELEPPHAELRGPRVRVMVVVETLAARQPRQHP